MRERSKLTSAPTGRAFWMPRSRSRSRKASIALRPSARLSFTRSSSAGRRAPVDRPQRRILGRALDLVVARHDARQLGAARGVADDTLVPRQLEPVRVEAVHLPAGREDDVHGPGHAAPSRARQRRWLYAVACSARAIVRRRWKSASSARVGVIVSSSARRVSRAASRQRAASASRPFAASFTTCSRWSECTSAVVGSERGGEQVAVPRDERLDGRARLLDLGRARPPLGQRLALAPHARGLGARRMIAERLDPPRRLDLGCVARLAAACTAGLRDGAGRGAGIEVLVGVGRARQREVALAAVARLAARPAARARARGRHRSRERARGPRARPARAPSPPRRRRAARSAPDLAARAHGGQQPVGLRADQHDDGVGGRLLDRLQQRVLHDLGHRLGVPDQVHAALGGEGPQLDIAPQLAHLVDADLRALRPHLEQIGVAALERALRQPRERTREAPRVRGDAVAGPAEQQVGVRWAAQGDAQTRPRCFVADQARRRGRRSQAQRLAHACGDLLGVAAAVDAHEAAVSARARRRRRRSPCGGSRAALARCDRRAPDRGARPPARR